MTDVEKARIELNKALSIDFSPDEQPITQAVEKLVEAIVAERLANYQTKPLRFR